MAEEIRHIFSSCPLVAVYHYNDLSVREWDGLRSKLEKKNFRIKVIPSKVSAKALEDTQYKNVSLLLRGSSAIAYSNDLCVSDLLALTRTEHKLHLLGGVVDNTLVTPEGVRNYAKLPDKTTAYQQLLGTLTLPQRMLPNMLQTSQMRLSQMLGQLTETEDQPRTEEEQ